MNRIWIALAIATLACICANANASAVERVKVLDSTISFVSRECGNTLITVITLLNESTWAVSDLIIEVRFFDANKNLVDAVVDRLYSVEIPGGESIAFRVQTVAAVEPERYVSHAVRVVSATEDIPPRIASADTMRSAVAPAAAEDEESWLVRLFISSFPILLLIAVWLWAMRWYSGKKSPQVRTMDFVEDQNDLLKEQVDVLRRMADAAEDKKHGS